MPHMESYNRLPHQGPPPHNAQDKATVDTDCDASVYY